MTNGDVIRCIRATRATGLTKGRDYKVRSIGHRRGRPTFGLTNDYGLFAWYDQARFERITSGAEESIPNALPPINKGAVIRYRHAAVPDLTPGKTYIATRDAMRHTYFEGLWTIQVRDDSGELFPYNTSAFEVVHDPTAVPPETSLVPDILHLFG